MGTDLTAARHDAYATDYDDQVRAYDCHLAEVLFGLCYEYIQPSDHLLDLGIGSGLSAGLFAKAGLTIAGMDISPVMLDICQAKKITAELKLHDLRQAPWPYPSSHYNHLVACGVFHFIPDLETIFSEAERVLRESGVFAFTTRWLDKAEYPPQKYNRQVVGNFEIFSHAPQYLELLWERSSFKRLKTQKCYVGDDLFVLWVLQKKSAAARPDHADDPHSSCRVSHQASERLTG